MKAIVLAGGPPDAVAALEPGAANKAFVRVAGTPLVTRVIATLAATPEIDEIVCVAPPQTHAEAALARANRRCDDGERIAQSLRSGLAGFEGDALALLVTADLPLLHPRSLSDFVARVETADADLAYGCVARTSHTGVYATVPHTWAHLGDGTFCGSGLIAIRPRAFASLERFLDRLGTARKSPLALAAIFGYGTLAKLALRRLRIVDAEARATVLLGAPARAIVSPYPEIAFNVDRQTDVALAERLLAEASPTRSVLDDSM